MKSFVCIKKCYYGERLWVPEENKVLRAEESPSKYFVEFSPDQAYDEEVDTIDPKVVVKTQIRDVLKKFNTDDKSFWTANGKPSAKKASEMLGFEVTRKELDKAWPGYTRDSGIKPLYKKAPTPKG